MTAALYDVADIHAFCANIARQRTQGSGQRLNRWQTEDLISYLTEEAYWLVDPRNPNAFDPHHGQSFSKFAWARLWPKYVDWNRKEFTDERYNAHPHFIALNHEAVQTHHDRQATLEEELLGDIALRS